MELYCIKCLYLIILISQFGVAVLTFGKLFVSRIKGTHSIHVNSKLLSINDRIVIRVREVLSIHVIYHISSSVYGVGNRRVWILGGGSNICDQSTAYVLYLWRYFV